MSFLFFTRQSRMWQHCDSALWQQGRRRDFDIYIHIYTPQHESWQGNLHLGETLPPSGDYPHKSIKSLERQKEDRRRSGRRGSKSFSPEVPWLRRLVYQSKGTSNCLPVIIVCDFSRERLICGHVSSGDQSFDRQSRISSSAFYFLIEAYFWRRWNPRHCVFVCDHLTAPTLSPLTGFSQIFTLLTATKWEDSLFTGATWVLLNPTRRFEMPELWRLVVGFSLMLTVKSTFLYLTLLQMPHYLKPKIANHPSSFFTRNPHNKQTVLWMHTYYWEWRRVLLHLYHHQCLIFPGPFPTWSEREGASEGVGVPCPVMGSSSPY